MKIASWNVNSLKVRLPQVLDWLEDEQPDVLGLQETKLTDERFPVDELAEAGYHAEFFGQKTYNGVALLSREPVTDVVKGMPGYDDPQARVIIGSVGGARIANLYVPNGSEVGSEKYDYKLGWLDHLAGLLEQELAAHPDMVVMGDFNIAPADADVHDPEEWRGKILFSEKEHAALQRILDLGFSDSFRLFEQDEGVFSWWDYRAAGFRRNRGLRIDLLLLSESLRQACVESRVDKEPRSWERPSDHAPVLINIKL